MKYKPLISFIIPIYNSEKYLHKCINSILRQTVKDYEIIIIDDGSSDNSFNICKEYEKNFNNIKLFHQTNQGVSIARNNGLNKSNGKWVSFIDSDDEIVESYIESILPYIVNDYYDLVQFDYLTYKNKESLNKNKLNLPDKIYDKNQVSNLLENIFSSKEDINCNVLRSACTKVYRKAFLDEKNIKFNPKLKMGEDFLFNINVYLRMNKLYYIRKQLYIIQERNDSVSRNYIKDMDEVDSNFYYALADVLKKFDVSEKIWELYYQEALIGIMRCMKYQYFNNKCNLSYREIKEKLKLILISYPYNKSLEIAKKERNLKRRIIAWLLYFEFFYIFKIFYKVKK